MDTMSVSFSPLASMRGRATSTKLEQMNHGSDPRPLRIVIVDDSHHFLDAACAALEQDGITVVGTASTSVEAGELVRNMHPDGILVDVDLGDESGLDLAREFATSQTAPVVLISAYPESDLADLIAASPAVAFVSKSELSASAIASLLATEHGVG
jgi:chemotaxis response regulator CheB